MVTPSARREGAEYLVDEKGYPVRVACKMVGVRSSTYYYEPKKRSYEASLVKVLHTLSQENPRYGYRRMTALLKGDGWKVNKKRIQRLWRKEGLKVSWKRTKKKRVGHSTTVTQAALYPNHVWSWDFVFDRTADGRQVKIFNIVDEYSRFNIALEAKRHFKGMDVIEVLGQSMVQYGIPGCIRSDNGSEFIHRKLKKWLSDHGIKIMYIEPGSPWENPHVESFNGKLRDECLNREWFLSLPEVCVTLSDHRKHHNTKRPHTALGYRTPAEVYDQYIKTGSHRAPVFKTNLLFWGENSTSNVSNIWG